MTRLPDLHRTLVEAAARLEESATATSPAATATRGGTLRARWRRMSRRGHVAGVLVGGLVLGAVATGSAQVAGLDPLGFDRHGKTDPALALSGDPMGSVNVTSAPGAAISWRVNAWVTRNGKVCVTGGRVNPERHRRDEYLYFCQTSDRAAQAVLDTKLPSRAIVGAMQLGVPSMKPKHALAFALTAEDAPGVEFQVAAPARLTTRPPSAPLRVPVDRSTTGLSPAGARFVRSLPPELHLRLTVAQVESDVPLVTGGDLAAYEMPDRPRAELAQVHVTSQSAWKPAHGDPQFGRINSLLEREPQPAEHQTRRQEQTYPVLTRPRGAEDEIPAAAMPRGWIADVLHRGRIQLKLSHRLRVSGEGDLGPIWIAPGGLEPDFTVPSLDGKLCLVGPRVLTDCTATPADGRRPDVEAVVCAPGLPRDQFLTWAHVPARATRVRVTYADGTTASYAAGDLLVLLRPRTKPLPTSIDWSGPGGYRKHERGPFPSDAAAKVCGTGKTRYWELRRSATTSAEGHQ